MPVIHHSAICVSDLAESLRFWRDGIGLTVLMDERFEGDWPTLLRAPGPSLRAVFLGDATRADAGIVELVDLGDVPAPVPPGGGLAPSGFLLLSLVVDVAGALDRLAALGLGGPPRRIEVAGVAIATVIDPDGVVVELVDAGAAGNLSTLTSPAGSPG